MSALEQVAPTFVDMAHRIVWCSAAVLVPIATFRFSRGLWTAIVHLTGGVY